MSKRYDKFFLEHISQLVQDKYDLSDEEMVSLIEFLSKFDSPKVALKNALKLKNQKSIESVVNDLFHKQKETEFSHGPVEVSNGLSFPLAIPMGKI